MVMAAPSAGWRSHERAQRASPMRRAPWSWRRHPQDGAVMSERSERASISAPEPYDFELDEFQRRAIAALDAGSSVLVAAPTGSGKTVVAEHAVADALATGGKAFYTTPIKALSNQKYADLARRHGSGSVGLLTGDNAINGD